MTLDELKKQIEKEIIEVNLYDQNESIKYYGLVLNRALRIANESSSLEEAINKITNEKEWLFKIYIYMLNILY